ncbi:MAG: hypothetical protein QF437_03955 [Planctomycetota bacterium]|jgi:hypothetical protein|nr:hypothetical protein [Planctomycetota bacterium]MDP7248030.1 hypothetical protein [Planctomycetota bacterium]
MTAAEQLSIPETIESSRKTIASDQPDVPQDNIPECLKNGTFEQLIEDRVFGRYIASLGYATLDQVQECLRLQGRILDRGGRKLRLSQILVARNYLTKTQMTRLNKNFEASCRTS